MLNKLYPYLQLSVLIINRNECQLDTNKSIINLGFKGYNVERFVLNQFKLAFFGGDKRKQKGYEEKSFERFRNY